MYNLDEEKFNYITLTAQASSHQASFKGESTWEENRH
jgi:hypothetical protein